jgi:hypothetical protein
MDFWWVNQNQTFRQELEGGYLWSPKRKADGRRNPFYEFMRVVKPGDLVFSFEGTYIRAMGVVQSFAHSIPKPTEFGGVGANWNQTGWQVDVRYHRFEHTIRPQDEMDSIAPVLPQRYSPLQRSGRGNQGVYLTRVNPRLAQVLIALIGDEATNLVRMLGQVNEPMQPTDEQVIADDATFEDLVEQRIQDSSEITETERKSVILARRGQGLFRARVSRIEPRCRITHVDRMEFLRASHIKPWSQCGTNAERLNGHNGLLLTPNIDHLFDRGFISFDDGGGVLVSPVANEASLERMGVDLSDHSTTGMFSAEQRSFMEYHRDAVFLDAIVG